MGQLVEGRWVRGALRNERSDGAFVRATTSFRARLGDPAFPPEPGRYRLIVADACPWAHRTMVVRALLDLSDAIPVTTVATLMGEDGWTEPEGRPLYARYQAAAPGYTGRVSVPVLWDEVAGTIVNNESAEIIRMLNGAFAPPGTRGPDLYPPPLRAAIDAINAEVYGAINNGVYQAGFATAQAPYAAAVGRLFAALNRIEGYLARQRWLVGNVLTEADVRLFTTLIRFDAVYVGHFKCNLRRLADYPHLSAYTRDIYQLPGVAGTVRLDEIKRHYYGSHPSINPSGVVPVGPQLDFSLPHGRDALGAAP